MGTTKAHMLALDSPQEYFQKLVHGACENQKISTSQDAE